MTREHGLTGILALFRLCLSNPVSRYIIKALLKEVEIQGEKRPLLDIALAYFAGVLRDLPPAARFVSELFSAWMELSLALLKTDDKFARELLADPPTRRGVLLVFKSIAANGLGKPMIFEAPFFIVWNFTNMCNLRCAHCYQRADGKLLERELKLPEKLKLVEELDKMFVCGVALSGGEPTIHPDFFTIMSEIARRGMYPAVATNGIALADPHFVRKMKKIGIRYVEISLDHSKPEVHDKFRGVIGAWEKTVRGIQNCVKEGLFTAIATTVTKLNLDDVENMLDLAEDLGVRRIVFFNFIPVGRGRDNYKLDLTPEEREEFMKLICRESRRRKIEIVTTAPQYGRVVLQETQGELAAPTHFTPALKLGIYKAAIEFIGGCGAGRVYCAVEPDGTVTPCVFMPIPRGNIRSESFYKIWREDELMNKLRDRRNLTGICNRCKYRDICGGCRARAFAYFGDPLADDPGCIYCRREFYTLCSRPAEPEKRKYAVLTWKV